MPLSAADLSTLSRLLDEALDLDLDPAQVDAWLAALPEAHAHLRPDLREMLAEHRAPARAGFLADGPKLDEAGADESVARAGEQVGPYRLIREIGRGGMGSVWLANRADGSLKRQIALKLPRLTWGAGLAERMARERDIGALLEHPNIARLYDAGVGALGRPYLALEYIDGQPLDAWCAAQSLSLRERLRLFLQVARAVAYAHGRLVVHRDLKPSNVLVTADGQAHLLDFGIAKLLHEAAPGDARLTQEQGRVLTPHFASPEQIKGEAITVASDVYSLGVVLYELLTGLLPYVPERKSLAALEEAILQGEPGLASSRAPDKAAAKALRGELDAILAKALKREPDRRYATADALAEDIQRHLNGDTVLAQPDSLGYRMRKTLRRHGVGFAAGSAILLAVLGGAGVSLVQARRANEAAERARVVKEFVVDLFNLNSPDNPSNAEFRKLPTEMLLEHGARLIETRFAGQAPLQAELYGVVGGIFADMGLPELAAEYATKQVAILATIDAPPAEQARALLLLAQALFDQKRYRDATEGVWRAIAMASSDSSLRLRARVLLAQALFKADQPIEGEGELASIEEALRHAQPGPNIVRARAMSLRAKQLTRANRFDEALALLGAAIDEALAAEGPLSRTAIDLRLNLADGLVSQHRFELSRAPREAALAALRALGGASEIRAALEESDSIRVMFHFGHIGFDEASARMERDRSFADAPENHVPDKIRATIALNLGELYHKWGEFERGDRLIAAAESTLQPSAQSPGAGFELATLLGFSAMDVGRHEQAGSLLQRRIALRKAMRAERLPWAVFDYIVAACNLGMQARFKEALEVLDMAPRFDTMRADPELSADDYADALEAMRARLNLDAGDHRAALAAMLGMKDAREPEWLTLDDRRLIRGEALCASQRRTEGLAQMQAAIADHARRASAHHPRLARARAVAGLCALAAGQRPLAEALAGQAHAAFVAQPGVSPYFKAPSERLDRLLHEPAPRP